MNSLDIKNQFPTPVKVSKLQTYLKNYDPISRAQILSGFTHGFDLGYRGHPNCKLKIDNHKSCKDHPDIVEKYLKHETSLGRISGPFDFPPFKIFQINPLGVIPKKDPGKFRLITDLSSPRPNSNSTSHSGKSINENIDKVFCEVTYSSLQDAIHLINNQKPGCWLSKTDIESAFRLLPISPDQRCLLGMSWQGKFYFDNCLPMGASSSCQLFERFSCALQFISESVGIRNSIHYLDDFLFINDSFASCENDLRLFKGLCKDIGVPLAPDKTVTPTQTLTFLGFSLDTVQGTVSLPMDKLQKCKDMIHEILLSNKLKVASLLSLQGLLSFSCAVIRPGRAFIRRLYSLTAGLLPHYYVRLDKEHKSDLHMWLQFLESYNGIDLYSDILAIHSNTFHLFSDASQSHGCGAFFNSHWFNLAWPSSWWRNQNITFLEITPIALALDTWGHYFTNSTLVIHTDNLSLVHVLSNQTSKEPLVMIWVRQIVLATLKLNIYIEVEHISGENNRLADLLSRLQVPAFLQLHGAADRLASAVNHLPQSMNCKT